MPRLTVTVTEEQNEYLEEISGDGGEYESKSEAVRKCITSDEQVQELEQTVERLQNENRLLIEQRKEHQELVEYVEEEKSLREVEALRRQQREQANIVTRAKWLLLGRPPT